MRLSISSTLLFALASTYALSIPDMTILGGDSLEKQLYNRHTDVILQEPIAKAQERADSHASKVKRGEYQPPHHPKYRPTGTAVPPLQTGSWERLALVKRRMEEESLEGKLVAREAREGMDEQVTT